MRLAPCVLSFVKNPKEARGLAREKKNSRPQTKMSEIRRRAPCRWWLLELSYILHNEDADGHGGNDTPIISTTAITMPNQGEESQA